MGVQFILIENESRVDRGAPYVNYIETGACKLGSALLGLMYNSLLLLIYFASSQFCRGDNMRLSAK